MKQNISKLRNKEQQLLNKENQLMNRENELINKENEIQNKQNIINDQENELNNKQNELVNQQNELYNQICDNINKCKIKLIEIKNIEDYLGAFEPKKEANLKNSITNILNTLREKNICDIIKEE